MMVCGVDNDCCRYVYMFAITIGSGEEMFLATISMVHGVER